MGIVLIHSSLFSQLTAKKPGVTGTAGGTTLKISKTGWGESHPCFLIKANCQWQWRAWSSLVRPLVLLPESLQNDYKYIATDFLKHLGQIYLYYSLQWKRMFYYSCSSERLNHSLCYKRPTSVYLNRRHWYSFILLLQLSSILGSPDVEFTGIPRATQKLDFHLTFLKKRKTPTKIWN